MGCNKLCGHTTEHRGETISWTGMPDCPHCQTQTMLSRINSQKDTIPQQYEDFTSLNEELTRIKGQLAVVESQRDEYKQELDQWVRTANTIMSIVSNQKQP